MLGVSLTITGSRVYVLHQRVTSSIFSSVLGAVGSYFGNTGLTAAAASSMSGDSLDNFLKLNNNFSGPHGGRAIGGPVSAGGVYLINEQNRPEVATFGGRDYLLTGGQGGTVRPASDAGTSTPFVGTRFKCLEAGTRARGLRTLDMFVSGLVDTGGLPDGLTLTLPKVTSVDQVEAMVAVAGALEAANGLSAGRIRFEVRPIPFAGRRKPAAGRRTALGGHHARVAANPRLSPGRRALHAGRQTLCGGRRLRRVG